MSILRYNTCCYERGSFTSSPTFHDMSGESANYSDTKSPYVIARGRQILILFFTSSLFVHVNCPPCVHTRSHSDAPMNGNGSGGEVIGPACIQTVPHHTSQPHHPASPRINTTVFLAACLGFLLLLITSAEIATTPGDFRTFSSESSRISINAFTVIQFQIYPNKPPQCLPQEPCAPLSSTDRNLYPSSNAPSLPVRWPIFLLPDELHVSFHVSLTSSIVQDDGDVIVKVQATALCGS